MQRQEFIEQFAELVARVKRIERWMDQWPSRDRRVQALIANEVRLNDASSAFHAGFKAGAGMAAAIIWTLPTADGSSGQTLITHGNGALAFSSDLSNRIDNAYAGIADIRSVIGNIESAIDGIRSRLNDLEADSHTHSD